MSVLLGTTRINKKNKDVTLSSKERSTHLQVVGASGRGKSKFLENLICQDIRDGRGLCLIDPHGALYDDVVAWLSTYRADADDRVHLIEPSVKEWCFGFNPLRRDSFTEPSVRVDAMVRACAQVWGGEDPSRTPLLKKCLRAVFYSLTVKDEGYTLLEATDLVNAMDVSGIRRYLTTGIEDQVYGNIWTDFNALPTRLFMEQFSSTNNRILEFLSAPVIRNIVGQRGGTIDFRRAMEEGEIVLVNLAPSSNLSPDNARLLGTLIVNDLLVTALGRSPKDPEPFYLYIDECYNYLNNDVESMLDQTRKFGLHLILSHQRLGQLREAGEGVYNAVMTGAQTKVVFGGLTSTDAQEMASDIFLGELDLEQGVELTKNPMVIAQEMEWLRSEMEVETKGGGSTAATSEGAADGLTETYDGEGNLIGYTVSAALSSGASAAESESWSHSVARGVHQALRSVYAERYSSVHPLDKVMYDATVKLVNQRPRRAVVKVPGRKSCQLTVPDVPDVGTLDQDVSAFKRSIFKASEYVAQLASVTEELSVRHEKLIALGALMTDPERKVFDSD